MDKSLITRIKPYLADIADRKVSGREVARILQVNEQHLSRTLKRLGVQRVPGTDRQRNKELRDARLDVRTHLATTLPIDQAARIANCHPRTIQRLLDKLEKKNGCTTTNPTT